MSHVYFLDIMHITEEEIPCRQNKRKYGEIIKAFNKTYYPCKKIKINHTYVFSKQLEPIGFA